MDKISREEFQSEPEAYAFMRGIEWGICGESDIIAEGPISETGENGDEIWVVEVRFA